MNPERKKRIAAVCGVAAVATGLLVVQAPPALAACAIYPGTNAIIIEIGGRPVLKIPATPEGLVGVCAEVETGGTPQVDSDVTVEVGESCGVPCFVVAWDGVTTGPVTVRLTVYSGGSGDPVEHTFPGENVGEFCFKAGMTCP